MAFKPWLDEEEEKQKEMNPLVRDYLTKKYGLGADAGPAPEAEGLRALPEAPKGPSLSDQYRQVADTKDVDAARGEAEGTNFKSNIGEALEGLEPVAK